MMVLIFLIQLIAIRYVISHAAITPNITDSPLSHVKALFFLILGLRFFFPNIKVGGGEKIKKFKTFFYLI